MCCFGIECNLEKVKPILLNKLQRIFKLKNEGWIFKCLIETKDNKVCQLFAIFAACFYFSKTLNLPGLSLHSTGARDKVFFYLLFLLHQIYQLWESSGRQSLPGNHASWSCFSGSVSLSQSTCEDWRVTSSNLSFHIPVSCLILLKYTYCSDPIRDSLIW